MNYDDNKNNISDHPDDIEKQYDPQNDTIEDNVESSAVENENAFEVKQSLWETWKADEAGASKWNSPQENDAVNYEEWESESENTPDEPEKWEFESENEPHEPHKWENVGETYPEVDMSQPDDYYPSDESASNAYEENGVYEAGQFDDFGDAETGANGANYREPWRVPVYREQGPDGSAYSPNVNSAYGSKNAISVPEKTKKQSRHGGFFRAACIVLVCVLLSSVACYGIVDYKIGQMETGGKQVVLGSDIGTAGTQTPGGTTTPVNTTGDEMLGKEIYAMGCEQVVGISTSVVTTNIFGQSTSTPVVGSGFIISNDGYIATNYHVIEYAVRYGYELNVIMNDKTSHKAEIIGYEQENDVAVIKINVTGLNAVTFGDSDVMQVGETIYAIGNPLGELDYTMTSGIVSALDRLIFTEEGRPAVNMFQIDAAINSGNSGGPVYNSHGEVIGIATAKYSSTGVEGLGFAIPINDVLDVVAQLIEQGYVSGKPYMGIMVADVTTSFAQYYNLVEGAYITEVHAGSPAEAAGLKMGDIIIGLGDKAVTSTETLKAAKRAFKAGDTTNVAIYRSGEELTFEITFIEENTAPQANNPQSSQTQSDFSQNPFEQSPFGGVEN